MSSPPQTDQALLTQLAAWMEAQEGERFEFKEAKSNYDFEKLARYACALANEGGGRVLLGVTDKRPRQVVGSQAFLQLEQLRKDLMEKLPLRLDVLEVRHPSGRVVVVDVPGRPVGMPMKVDGRYWARKADSLVTLSEERLREIFAEIGHDFSADTCRGASFAHLDLAAIEDFRKRWIEKSKNASLATLSPEQLLRDAELLRDDQLTYAALILFGTRDALGRFLAQSEVVFEYRSSEAAGPAQQRKEYRQGFFSFYDDLWNVINLRNDLQHYQDGLFVLDVATFAERSVREAILNAVSHRDYQLGGNIFVRQYARRLVIESPGGLPHTITLENLLDRQSPRNRRIADVFAKCGLVERSGQGMNLMFEQSIRQGKLRPDFTGTDSFHVVVTLNGEVQDARFLQFLEKVGREGQASFGTHDFMVLDLVHREEPVPDTLQTNLLRLRDLGIVEMIGRGRGASYLLGRRFYSAIGERGSYTRRRGLDRDTNKQLLEKHVRENDALGSRMEELRQVLPALSRSQIQVLLREMVEDKRVHVHGATRAARWHHGPGTPDCNHEAPK